MTKMQSKSWMVLFALLGLIAVTFQSCDDDDDDNNLPDDGTPLFQLVINQSNEGQRGEFLTTRAAFIDALVQQPGVSNDDAWRPFFTTDPNIDVDRVLAGVTEWSSSAAMMQGAASLLPQPVFTNYDNTFSTVASVVLEPLDGKVFDFESLRQQGRVVEFAIREAIEDNAFGAKREAFFNTLPQYDGFLFDREFKVYALNPDGSLTLRENVQAVAIAWEDQAKFFAAATPLFASAEYADFAAAIQPETYFATTLANLSQSDDVFELAVRQLKEGVSVSEFTAARDAFVATLAAQPGAFHDREVQPYFDYTFSGMDTERVYIGMTQYENLATYGAIGQQLGSSPEAANFFSKFDPLSFEALQPISGYGPVDLATVAPLGSGQVLEIAVRDLSQYENFDAVDYEAKRDAFLGKLSQQSGYVQEIQWRSATNENVVVGMTVYESAAAAQTILSDATFTSDPDVQAFLGGYPVTTGVGILNQVLK